MKNDVKFAIAILLLTLLATPLLPLTDNHLPIWDAEPSHGEELTTLGRSIFEDWVLPFELLSLALLAALIAAVFMAKREPEGEP
ncbi:MAG: NADH-quinone oxidoreductase subunit J [Methanobacteriota archaeon]